jgi:hypothetical protein
LENEKEKSVIDRQKEFLKNLFFAEKVRLKEIKKLPLSVNEWRKIENQSVNRNDHFSICAICLDSLSKRDTLILSCSHVFHKICISNFENFTQNKKCPICRFSNYESKDYHKDKEAYIQQKILVIQKGLHEQIEFVQESF